MSFNVTTYFLDRNLEAGRGGHTALLHGEDAVSYAELATLTNRVGTVLRDLGVRRGDRVLLALSDGVEFVATWYAAQKIGAITAEVYTFLQAKDYAYYLGYTEPAVVVVDPTTLDRMRSATPRGTRLLVVGDNPEPRPTEHSFADLVPAASAELTPADTELTDPAIWKFTTGSTGAPKACVHPTAAPMHSFFGYARGVLDIDVEDVVLPVPKLFFGYARDLAALFPFGVGATGIVFDERSTPERIFTLIERHRPTILATVPTMMKAMIEYADVDDTHGAVDEIDLSCLRLATSAGEALPARLYHEWYDRFGVEVLDGIGSSEAYHIYVSNRPDHVRPGSAGIPVPGYTATVTGDPGEPVPDGEIGTLEITGPTVAYEYWREPAKTAETFRVDDLETMERTVRSGDLFSRDRDGFLHHRGRADDLLKVGGVWVAPSEIERCLLDHPDVAECAVVRYTVDGLEQPRAYVVSRAGAEVSANELREFVRSTLAPHKYPRDIRFLAELPKTGSGKLDRRALREREDTE